ncbi:histidine phosphatase family protein [Novosphingobium sp. SL115]|uniref:histidine phosphatase family protein n=1 Tax=Novosphingobium sp. SL115 TaxID=2995150 RepID=UPI00227236BA|nr:histidine phosphatase family protein [Novosphingobium sp. SL115]MCY1670980.1 histidine phosphatase family protein [Novosphingobium sp. SL115]
MLVIVRHGNTFGAEETPRRIGARTDLPLTGRGHEQAGLLGAHFAGMGWQFSRALVSPLLRTMQTAQAILAAQTGAVSIQTADFLREIDHGPDENRSEADVVARIGVSALESWDKSASPPPGWIVDADGRIAAWQTVLASLTENCPPTLLVTSNGAARFALLADSALRSIAPTLPSLKLPTGGYGVIRRLPDGALDVPCWGQRP